MDILLDNVHPDDDDPVAVSNRYRNKTISIMTYAYLIRKFALLFISLMRSMSSYYKLESCLPDFQSCPIPLSNSS